MADVNREVLIKLGFDSTEVDRGLNLLKGSFTELNSTLSLLQRGIGVATEAFRAFEAVLQRGQAVHELKTAFDNLYGSTTALGNEGLSVLRGALQGTVSDVNILKEANLAAQAGLAPDQFLKLAAAAEKLGDIVGKGPTEALHDLTLALSTGNERLLKQYGILVDNEKAELNYAKALGVTKDILDETAKREAFRIEASKQFTEAQKRAGEGVDTAAEALERLNVKLENTADHFANLLNNQPAIVAFFRSLESEVDKFGNSGGWQRLFIIMEGLPGLGRRLGLEFGKQLAGWPAGDSAGLSERDSLMSELLADLEQQADKRRADEALRLRQRSRESAVMIRGEFEAQKLAFQQFADFVSDTLETSAKDGILQGLGLAQDNTWLTDQLNQRFQDSADFFSDALYNAMTGAAFDAKDIMYRILAGVAGGFLSQLTGGLGAGFGSPQGLGQLLGQALAGGGTGALAGAFGSGGSGSAAILGGGGFSLAALAGYAPIAAAAGTGFVGLQAGQSVAGGNRLSTLQQIALALPTFGAVLAANPIMSALGIGGGIDRNRSSRDEILNQLGSYLPTVQGVRPMQLHGGNNVVDFSNPLAGQAVGLANPLAQILSGGDDELKTGLAGVFANATSQASNFNEVLINTQALFDAFNIQVPDAKDQITALFLDGKVSLEEFNAGMASLNVLAQDNLVGQGSVADAMRIVADAMATPRARIKGLELAFKEMGEIGVDTASEVSAYLIDRFGPDAVRVFDELRAAGIDTWEEVANASSDQINLMANLLNGLSDSFADAFQPGPIQETVASIDELRQSLNEATIAAIEFRRNFQIGGPGQTKPRTGRTTNLNSGTDDLTG